MRVSIVEGDRGWVVDPHSYRVTLDGVQVSAVTADEETGEVQVWDAEEWQRGVATTRRLTGKVRVERWEQGEIDHPHGTVGFLGTDGWWYWSHPEHDDYAGCRAKATHWWDVERKVWVNPKHLVVH